MVDKTGNVKLIDFGASKQLNTQKGGATTSTAISYTNGYAPREQMEQSYDKFGPWTDIYALGATLYNLLTNRRPPMPTDIDDDTSVDKHNSLPLSGVSESMKKLILSMMQTNRMKRPQDVSEISNLIVNSPEVSFLKSEQSFNNETQKAADEVTVIEKPYIQKPISNPSELGTLELGEKKKGRWPLYTLLITLAVLLLVGIGLLCAILLKQNESNSNNTETTSQHTVNSSSQSVNSEEQYDMGNEDVKVGGESKERKQSGVVSGEIQDILNALDNNINVLDVYSLRELYSDYVKFYGTVMNKDKVTMAIETQRNKFAYYEQENIYPRVTKLNDMDTRCDYIKRVTIDGNTTDYEAYIVLERDGMGSYVIIEESDKTTDRNLEKQSRR
jgi:serine/threonine protein kinase